ncbi:MAG: Crp/Fnr family transcriptional regulator [Pyrinomonadaceae bacterium]|nr:Crp/Fnr family transcriptional regulator [Pyrinomonadaceae bacterium]
MIRINRELLDFIGKIAADESNNFISQHNFSPKKIVIEQGDKIEFVHIIKSGIAKCYLTNEDGNIFIQEFFGEGVIFGEIEMFNEDETVCAVESMTDLVIYKISRNNFYKLLEENPQFNRLVLRALAAKIKFKAIRYSNSHLNPIETNLLLLKKQFPELFKTIAKPDIANYLGVTERSLNRSIKSLREKKLI